MTIPILYHCRDARSLRCLWAAEEAGLEIELRLLPFPPRAVATVTVMDYTSLIWTALAGWLVWDHLPPLTTWLGAPLIVAAGLVVLWRERILMVERAKELAA